MAKRRVGSKEQRVGSYVMINCELNYLLNANIWLTNALDTTCTYRPRKIKYIIAVCVLRSKTNMVSSQTSQVRLIKSVKTNAKKQNGRKAVLVVRRLIDDKGFHTRTEVDIKSNRVAEVMQEINSDVQEISLRTTPPVVRSIL